MQLLPGESKIATLGNITLTTRRVQYERNEWGSRKITTIPLDHLTSCDIEAHSKPKWIVLGGLAIALALYTQFAIVWGLSVLFLLAWFATRRKSIVLRSASEKIEYVGPFGQWTALQDFLQKVHIAKGKSESLAAGRHEEMLVALRASAAPPIIPSRHEEVVKDTKVPAATPAAPRPLTEEHPALPPRTPLWITSSSTLHVSALSSSVAPMMARAESVSRESATQQKPLLDSAGPEQGTSSDAGSVNTPSNVSRPDPVPPGVQLQSQPAADTEAQTPVEAKPVFLPEQCRVADSLSNEPTKRHTRTIVVCLSVLAVSGLLVAAIFIFRSRPVDTFTPENRALVNGELQRWSESFRTGDAAAHVNCYAPVIETYFKMRQVPREQLLRDKQKAFAAISVVTAFELSNIQFSPEPNNRIAATFQKDWDYSMNSGKGFLGSEIEKLTFENVSTEWKIVKEEELRIIRAVHPVRDSVAVDQTPATQAGAFRYAQYRSSYLAEELCSESMPVSSGRYCYPYGWRPWLKELERKIAGTKADALDRDTGTQSPGNLVIWWDSEPRIVFSGCRPHDCPEARAYFIVAPRTRQMDIIWSNERGVSYFGPNAVLLRGHNGFTLLEQIEIGKTD